MELRIKETAKRKGYTLSKLSDKINIDTTTLSRYNTGKVEAPLHKLKLIAEALNVELCELIPTTTKDYAHWVDEGIWRGIRRK